MMSEEDRIKIKKKAFATPWDSLVEFTCEECGKLVSMRSANVRKKKYLLCNPCQIRYSKSLRTEEDKKRTHEKTVATCMERYGVANGGGSEEAKRKARETWVRNWGSLENCFEQRAEKAHETFLEKYDGSYSTPEILEKKTRTIINRYGSVENCYKQITEKAVATNIENHGGVHSFQNKEWQQRSRESMLEKWGVERFAQNKEEWEKVCDRYHYLGGMSGTWKYDNKLFDSFWEIAFYIHLQNAKIEFVYQPDKHYEYINDEGKASSYFPDFIVDGKIYEVKGDHFFNEDGDPVDCRGRKWFNKLKCMESLGVTLITSTKRKINTTMKILNIDDFLQECFDTVEAPSSYSFRKSCRADTVRGKMKQKKLYSMEEELIKDHSI